MHQSQNCVGLENIWYVAALSRDVRPGKMIRREIAGRPLLFARTARKAKDSALIFALRDQCPHRGAPLSHGKLITSLEHSCVECPYHGWQFNAASGRCGHVPALSRNDQQSPAIEGISVLSFPVREQNGLIWVFIGDEKFQQMRMKNPHFETTISLPDTGIADFFHPKSQTLLEVEGPFLEAVTGLVDPAHTPFVHQQWWWRKGRKAEEKKKTYQQLPFGFRIPYHEPSSNSKIYSLLGGAPTTQIDFLLPSIRVETIKLGEKKIIGLTAITPIAEGRSRLYHILYWDVWPLSLLKPMVDAMALSFLSQDARILNAQSLNLDTNHNNPIYLGEADVPAKWLRQIFLSWRAQMVSNGAGELPLKFDNPVNVQPLHWKT